MMNKYILVSAFLFFVSSIYSDFTLGTDGPILISFEINGQIQKIEIDKSKLYEIYQNNPPPKEIHIDNYKIDRWVYAALQALKLKYEVKTTGSSGKWQSTIFKIETIENNQKGEWVFYVNNIKSNYHISTQLDTGVKNIDFKFQTKK